MHFVALPVSSGSWLFFTASMLEHSSDFWVVKLMFNKFRGDILLLLVMQTDKFVL